MSDEHTTDLLDRISGGDREALGTLFSRYERRLERFVHGHTDASFRQQVPVEDVCQQAHLIAMTKIDGFVYRRELSFFFWLCQIARNLILENARRLRRKPPPVSLNVVQGQHSTSGQELLALVQEGSKGPVERRGGAEADALEALLGDERLHLLGLALAELRPRDREALILKYIEGHGNEAAKLVGASPTAFRSRTARALLQLRDALDRLTSSSPAP